MMSAGGAVFNEDFMIPNNLVGLVIGRGGEKIKKLQSDSQCKIRIASESNGTPERSCTLTGSQEQIDLAKQMLEEVIVRSQNRDQDGGDRGSYQRPQGGNYQQRQQGGYGGGQQSGGYQQGGYGGQRGGYGGQQGGYGGQQGGYGGRPQQ